MPPRYIRNTTVLAKIEAVYGTDSIPTGAANAILVSDVSIEDVPQNVARDLIRSWMGASEELVGNKYIKITMTVELQNGGTAGTAPAWSPLIRACAAAESALLTPARVEYTPVTTGHESTSIYYFMDGVLHKALGAKGNPEFGLGIGKRPTMKLQFVALDGGISADVPTGVSFSGFKTPLVVTDSNVSQFLLGCSYAAGALTGGAAAVSQGLDFSSGTEAKFVPKLNGNSVDISNRAGTGKLTLELDAAAEVAMKAAIDANTLTSIGMKLGATAGYTVMAFLPSVQRTNPKYEEVDGLAMLGMDLRLIPAAGNDEWRLILL